MSNHTMNESEKNSTKERILDAAEELFSEKGFAETSMRDITSLANVNLASINYHFGSKEELINAVFVRTVEPLAQALDENLSKFEHDTSVNEENLETSLRVLVKAGLKRARELKGGGGIFMRLLSRAYSDPEAKARNYLAKRYSTTLLAYVKLLSKILKNISPEELYWRAYSMLGSVVFVMSAQDTLKNIAQRDYQFYTSDEAIIEHLVKFLAAGFRA